MAQLRIKSDVPQQTSNVKYDSIDGVETIIVLRTYLAWEPAEAVKDTGVLAVSVHRLLFGWRHSSAKRHIVGTTEESEARQRDH